MHVYKSVKLLISSLSHRFLTEDAAKTLVTSYILSRLDYCNCLLMGTPNSVIQPLQKIQIFAARLVLLAPRHHHSKPLLEKMHWLPISERIKYKVACMCFSAINGSGPAYLSELLHVYTPSRALRSSFDNRMLKSTFLSYNPWKVSPFWRKTAHSSATALRRLVLLGKNSSPQLQLLEG